MCFYTITFLDRYPTYFTIQESWSWALLERCGIYGGSSERNTICCTLWFFFLICYLLSCSLLWTKFFHCRYKLHALFGLCYPCYRHNWLTRGSGSTSGKKIQGFQSLPRVFPPGVPSERVLGFSLQVWMIFHFFSYLVSCTLFLFLYFLVLASLCKLLRKLRNQILRGSAH